MIDYIKVQLVDFDSQRLLSNPLLDFYDVINTDTGEIRTTNKDGKIRTPYKSAFFQGLEFRIYDTGTILLMGSLHKYWNQGLHNYNDFNYSNLKQVIDNLQAKFQVSPIQMKLRVVEIGVNIIPPYTTLSILRNLINHRRKRFEWTYLNGKGDYVQASHTQFYVKVYDKAKQYRDKFDISGDLLRFEIKVIKMEKLKSLNIETVSDLINVEFKTLGDFLINEWEQILFYDFTITSSSRSILNYRNAGYWMELIDDRKISAYNKHKAKLKKITQESSEHIQEQISKLIQNKCFELSKSLSLEQADSIYEGICFDSSSSIPKGVQNDHLIIGAIDTPFNKPNLGFGIDINQSIENSKKNRRCWITGCDISMQKDESFLVYNSALRHYYGEDRKTFELLKNRYLPKRWSSSDLPKQINEIAHAIRSRSQVVQNKHKRLYSKDQQQLF